MKFISLVLFLLCYASGAYGIDLATMQEMALNNRELIKQYTAELEQSEQDLIRARGGYYPSVDVGYTVNSLDEASTDEHRQNSVISGKISYNLFTGFRDRHNIYSAEKLRAVEEYRLQGIKQDVQLNVALTYLEVYERLANRKVAASAFETLEKVYKDGESRYQVGLIGKNELLKFRVDYDNADITLKAADAGLRKGINDLSRQVGQKVVFEDLDFKDFNQLPQLIDKKEYLKKMLLERSEIKALEAVGDASKARTKAESSGYYPQVDLIGRYSRYDDNYINGNGDVEEDELRAQLVMTMNLFQGFATEAAVAGSKSEVRAVQYQLAELKHQLSTALENLYIDFEVSLENVGVANRSIEQAEENLRITQLKYDEGLQRESDLLDAITSLSRAQYNYVSVIRTVFLKNFQLTRMIDGF